MVTAVLEYGKRTGLLRKFDTKDSPDSGDWKLNDFLDVGISSQITRSGSDCQVEIQATADMLYVRGAHAVGELDCANLILRRFLDKPSSPESNNAVAEILRSFNIPDFLNTRTCIDLNGYFGCRGKYKEEHDNEEHDKEKYNKEEHDKKKHSLESYSMTLWDFSSTVYSL